MRTLCCTGFTALLTATALAKGGPPMHLVLPPLPQHARIMGLSLQIDGGKVNAIAHAPDGWQISIDNDPSWHGTFQATAVVGAAAISKAELGRMLTLQAAPPGIAKDLASSLSVTGTITTLDGGEPVTSPVTTFKLAP